MIFFVKVSHPGDDRWQARGKLMYPVTDTARQITAEIVHERKHPDRAPPGRRRVRRLCQSD